MSVLSLSLGKKTGRLPERRRPAFPMVALALLFSLLALLPLGFVVAVGFDTGWPTIKALVFRPRVGELLSNTLWLTVLAVPISIVLGVTLARLTERTALAGRQLWSALAVAAGNPGLCPELRLGQCRAFAAWPLRRGVSLGARLLSVYLYAGGGRAAPPRSHP